MRSNRWVKLITQNWQVVLPGAPYENNYSSNWIRLKKPFLTIIILLYVKNRSGPLWALFRPFLDPFLCHFMPFPKAFQGHFQPFFQGLYMYTPMHHQWDETYKFVQFTAFKRHMLQTTLQIWCKYRLDFTLNNIWTSWSISQSLPFFHLWILFPSTHRTIPRPRTTVCLR